MIRVLIFVAAFALAAHAANAQTSRFYLRGDLGLVLGTPAVETDVDPGSAIASLGPTTINGTYGTGMMFDAGVGFRAFPFLRLEGTIGYLPSLAFKGNFGNTPSGTTQSTLSALVGLATANVDLTAFTGRLPGGLQPFVLGGLGFAAITNSREDDYTNGVAYNGSISGATQTNLAWTVGGGVGVPVTDRLTLDVAYRWLDLGERRLGPTLSFNGATAPTTYDRADLRVHTIMVGLRYQL
ncbi:MAG TPA: outer membrane beta-barrel protein [Reyranella sp.]|jgi:opacity protein-like surface antigen